MPKNNIKIPYTGQITFPYSGDEIYEILAVSGAVSQPLTRWESLFSTVVIPTDIPYGTEYIIISTKVHSFNSAYVLSDYLELAKNEPATLFLGGAFRNEISSADYANVRSLSYYDKNEFLGSSTVFPYSVEITPNQLTNMQVYGMIEYADGTKSTTEISDFAVKDAVSGPTVLAINKISLSEVHVVFQAVQANTTFVMLGGLSNLATNLTGLSTTEPTTLIIRDTRVVEVPMPPNQIELNDAIDTRLFRFFLKNTADTNSETSATTVYTVVQN